MNFLFQHPEVFSLVITVIGAPIMTILIIFVREYFSKEKVQERRTDKLIEVLQEQCKELQIHADANTAKISTLETTVAEKDRAYSLLGQQYEELFQKYELLGKQYTTLRGLYDRLKESLKGQATAAAVEMQKL